MAKFYPSLFSDRAHNNLERLAHRTTRSTYIDTHKPFIEIHSEKHAAQSNFEDTEEIEVDDYLDEEDREIPWGLFLEARSFRPTQYYYFMFGAFWDIICINEWKSLSGMTAAFQDLPAVVDKHLARLKSLTPDEFEMYLTRLEHIQERLDSLVAADSCPSAPDPEAEQTGG